MYVQMIYPVRGYYSKYMKNPYNQISQNPNNPIKKRAADLNRHFSKDTQITNRHMKRCSTSLSIRETQTKTTRYHLTPVRMTTIKKIGNSKC